MEVTFIINGSLLIKADNKRVLLDALIDDDNLFLPMPDEINTKIFLKEEPFDALEYILFTHDHGDHYSRQKCDDYAHLNGDKGMFLPLPNMVWDGMQIEDGNMIIKYYQSEHIDIPLVCNEHYCLTIEDSRKKILITVDAKMNIEWFEERFSGTYFDAVICNPVAISDSNGRYILKKLNPGKVYIYHVPPEDNDPYSYYTMALANVNKYKDELPPCRIIREPMTNVVI